MYNALAHAWAEIKDFGWYLVDPDAYRVAYLERMVAKIKAAEAAQNVEFERLQELMHEQHEQQLREQRCDPWYAVGWAYAYREDAAPSFYAQPAFQLGAMERMELMPLPRQLTETK